MPLILHRELYCRILTSADEEYSANDFVHDTETVTNVTLHNIFWSGTVDITSGNTTIHLTNSGEWRNVNLEMEESANLVIDVTGDATVLLDVKKSIS